MSNWQGMERSHITRSQETWILILLLKLACVSQQFISLPVQYEDWTVLQMNQQMVSVCKPLPLSADFSILRWEYHRSLNFCLCTLPLFHLPFTSQEMDFNFLTPFCLQKIPKMLKLAFSTLFPFSSSFWSSFLPFFFTYAPVQTNIIIYCSVCVSCH